MIVCVVQSRQKGKMQDNPDTKQVRIKEKENTNIAVLDEGLRPIACWDYGFGAWMFVLYVVEE